MNTSQVSGITNNILGIIQEHVGIIFGIQDQQLAGKQRQSLGAAKKNLGDARYLINAALKQMQKSEQAFQIQSSTRRIRTRSDQNLLPCAKRITYLKKLN
jgi:uncharacterized protein YjbJ (UPF0337 family)